MLLLLLEGIGDTEGVGVVAEDVVVVARCPLSVYVFLQDLEMSPEDVAHVWRSANEEILLGEGAHLFAGELFYKEEKMKIKIFYKIITLKCERVSVQQFAN